MRIFKNRLMNECVWDKQGCANDLWKELSMLVRQVAKEVLGESKGYIRRKKETRWWNNNVQEKIKFMKQCFKDLNIYDSEENWVKYRLAKKEEKKAVSVARSTSFEEFYKELGTKDGEQKIYRIAKIKEHKSRDLDQVRCVKDEEGNVLVNDDNVRDKWKNYFYRLFNDREETMNYELDDLVIVHDIYMFLYH